jgi:hypothetical protein
VPFGAKHPADLATCGHDDEFLNVAMYTIHKLLLNVRKA